MGGFRHRSFYLTSLFSQDPCMGRICCFCNLVYPCIFDNDTVLSDVEVQFDESNIDKEIVNKEIIVDDNYLTDDDYNETEDILNRLKGE